MRFSPLLLAAPLGTWAVTFSRDGSGDHPPTAAKDPGPGGFESQTRGQSFSVSQTPNKAYRGGDAPMELVRAHAKFSESLPPWLAKVVEANPSMNQKFKSLIHEGDGGDETATVPAKPPPSLDLEYVMPVEIGTPGQKINMNLDTGSSDFWAFSSDTYKLHVEGQTLYRPNASQTSELQVGESWSVMYGDGSGASGIVYKDRVQVGGTSFDKQAVQSAVDVSRDIAGDNFSSGIMGMAFDGSNTVRPTRQKTYIENIRDELEKPVFTANLQRGKPGNYNFGYIDDSEYYGPFGYSSVVDGEDSYWKVPIDGYQVGADGKFANFTWNGVVDTGTTLILVPDVIVNDYYAQIKGAHYDPLAGTMVFPCDAEAPDFIFGIASYRGTVPGHYINYGQANPTECYGGIQSSEGIGMSIIGDVLIKAQFVVFDLENRRVGFANKKLQPA